jgi:hypothetical protein
MVEVVGLEGLGVSLRLVRRAHKTVVLGMLWTVTGLPVMCCRLEARSIIPGRQMMVRRDDTE